MDDKKRKQVGTDMVQAAMAMIESRRDWLETVQLGRQIVQGDGPYMKAYFPTTQQFHFPVIEEKIDSFYPRVSTSFWGTNPVVRVRPLTGGEPLPDAEDLEDFGTWAVHYDIPDFYVQWECWNRNALVDGVSTIKTLWQEDWQRTLEVRRIARDFPPGMGAGGLPAEGMPEDPAEVSQMQPVAKSDEDILDEVFTLKAIQSLEIMDAEKRKYKIELMENGRRFPDVIVEIGEAPREDQWEVRTRRLILKHASPVAGVIEPPDLLVPYRASDPQTSELTIHQTWRTYPEIKQLVARSGWNLTKKELEFLEHGPGKAQEEFAQNAEFKEMQDEFSGESNPMFGDSHVNGKFLVLECYKLEDLEDDGYCSEVIYHVLAKLQKCVKAEYLEESVPHGHRPFATLFYKPASDRYYVTGLASQLMAINMQVNMTFNQINENQAYINRPYGFYEPTALMTDMDVFSNLKPGDMVPVNSAQGIHFPQWPQTPLADMQLMTSVMMMGDRLGGIPPLMGGSTQMKNAPRTARGTLALISEGNVRIDNFIERAQKTGWKELLFQIFGLYDEYVDGEKWFWVVKKPKLAKRFTANQRRNSYDYYFEGNSVNTNPEVMRTIAQVRYQMLAAEPRYMQDLGARDELIKSVLKAYSEGIDVERAMPKSPGGGGTHQPMSQDQENELIYHGQWVEPLATDDHIRHLADIKAIVSSQMFGNYSEAAVAMLSAHYNMHVQMLQQAQQPQQLQPTGSPGTANNTSMQETAMGEVGAL